MGRQKVECPLFRGIGPSHRRPGRLRAEQFDGFARHRQEEESPPPAPGSMTESAGGSAVKPQSLTGLPRMSAASDPSL